MSAPRRKNLVVLRAGDGSLHPQWLAGPQRDFDLFVSYYGKVEGRHRDSADLWEHRPGPKWSCIADLMAAHPGLVEQYDAFWFPDDDLAADTDTLNRMFALFQGFGLKLAQPALTRDSYFSWRQLLQRDEFVLRHVAFVEVMAPLFTRSSLQLCLPSFGSSRSGWGLDWVWPKLLGGGEDGRIAILDATPVKHTRPVGGELYKNNPELDPRVDNERLATAHGQSELRATGKFICYGGIGQRNLSWAERFKLWLQRANGRRVARRRARKASEA
jgi:hypothetical protein